MVTIEDDVKLANELRARLDDGYKKIEQAQLEGKDTANWTGLWLGLLEQYEDLMDRIMGGTNAASVVRGDDSGATGV